MTFLRSIIAFLLTEGAWDNAEGWTTLSADERNTTKAAYNDAGIALMVSVFGSSDTPTSSGADPTDTANTMAAWVIQYGLDGIDVDYEVSLRRSRTLHVLNMCSTKRPLHRTSTRSMMELQKLGSLHSLRRSVPSSLRATTLSLTLVSSCCFLCCIVGIDGYPL